MSECFQNNQQQAELSRWLHLPTCTLGSLAQQNVALWNDHAVADFQEMLTLYLNCKLLHQYLEVCTAYYILANDATSRPRCCTLRRVGRLCCDKLRKDGLRFCSYSHACATDEPAPPPPPPATDEPAPPPQTPSSQQELPPAVKEMLARSEFQHSVLLPVIREATARLAQSRAERLRWFGGRLRCLHTDKTGSKMSDEQKAEMSLLQALRPWLLQS